MTLSDLSSGALADRVARLRSAQGCQTKRLTSGDHEFVVAKHTDETRTTLTDTLELCWVAGETIVTEQHIKKLQSSARSIDASRACIVTVGDGDVKPPLDETVRHLSGSELRERLQESGLIDTDSETPDNGGDSAPQTGRARPTSTSTGDSSVTNTAHWDDTTFAASSSRSLEAWDVTTTAEWTLDEKVAGSWEGWDGASGDRKRGSQSDPPHPTRNEPHT